MGELASKAAQHEAKATQRKLNPKNSPASKVDPLNFGAQAAAKLQNLRKTGLGKTIKKRTPEEDKEFENLKILRQKQMEDNHKRNAAAKDSEKFKDMPQQGGVALNPKAVNNMVGLHLKQMFSHARPDPDEGDGVEDSEW